MQPSAASESLIRQFMKSRFVVRLSDDTLLSTLVFKWVVPTFLGGAIGFTYMLLGSEARSALRWEIALALLFLTATSVFFFLGLTLMKFVAVTELQSKYTIDSVKGGPASEDESPYAACIRLARQASKSIYVIGPHFSMSTPVATNSHTDYLTRGIDVALENALSSSRDASRGDFVYQRILQLEPGFPPVVQGMLSVAVIGDKGVQQHVTKALELKAKAQKSGRLKIRINAMDFIPSFPSVLIIDDHHVFFSLPCFPYAKGSTRSDDSDPGYSYDFVLHLKDQTGATAAKFRQLFEELLHEGNEIKRLS